MTNKVPFPEVPLREEVLELYREIQRLSGILNNRSFDFAESLMWWMIRRYAPPVKAGAGAPETTVKQCIVRGCPNRSDQGGFVGDLCSPCWDFTANGYTGGPSRAYHNALQVARALLVEETVGKLLAGFLSRSASPMTADDLSEVIASVVSRHFGTTDATASVADVQGRIVELKVLCGMKRDQLTCRREPGHEGDHSDGILLWPRSHRHE